MRCSRDRFLSTFSRTLLLGVAGCGASEDGGPPAPSTSLPRSGEILVQGTQIDTATWLDERGRRTGLGSVVATQRTLQGGGTATELYQVTTEGQVRLAVRLGAAESAATDFVTHRGARAAVGGRTWIWGGAHESDGGWARELGSSFDLRELTPLNGGAGGYAALVEGPDGRLIHLRSSAGGTLDATSTVVLEGSLPLGLARRAVLVPATDSLGVDQPLVVTGTTGGVPMATVVNELAEDQASLSWTGLDPVLEVLPRELAVEQADGTRWIGWQLDNAPGEHLIARVEVAASAIPAERSAVLLAADDALGASELLLTDVLAAGSVDPDLEGMLLVAGTFLEGVPLGIQAGGTTRVGFVGLLDPTGTFLWSRRLEGPLGNVVRVQLGRTPEAIAGAATLVTWTGQGATALDTWSTTVVPTTGDLPTAVIHGWEGGLPGRAALALTSTPPEPGLDGDPPGPTLWSWWLETGASEQVVLGSDLALLGAWGEGVAGRPFRLSWSHRNSRLTRGLTVDDPTVSSFGTAAPPAHASCLYAAAMLAPESGVGVVGAAAPVTAALPASAAVLAVEASTRELDVEWTSYEAPAILSGSVPNACD